MKHLFVAIAALLTVAAVTLLPAAPASAHGCSAWVSGSRGTGYCSQSSGHSARLAVVCRTGIASKWVYYPYWSSTGGVQVVYCPSGWYASFAYMQTR